MYYDLRLLRDVADVVTIASVGVTRGAAIVQAPAAALIDKVIGVAEGDVTMSATILGDVADVMPRAGVGMAVSATKVELEAVALVGDEVGIAVGSLPLRKSLILASNRVGSDKGSRGNEESGKLSEDHCDERVRLVELKDERM